MNIAQHYFSETDLTIEIIEFDSGEQNKNIETCIQMECPHELGADRKCLIINLGAV
jgi:3-dehydroquinate synthase